MKKIQQSVRNVLHALEANLYGPYIWTVAFQTLMPILTASLPTYCFSDALNICCRWLMQTNPWHKDRPQWSTGSAFQEQQEGLTMKLLRLLPFCAEALKKRHSASFFSSSPRWGFYRELLKSLETYRANSLMGCWLIDWWLCLSRCCKSWSGVTLTHIKKHTMLLCDCFVMFPRHKLVGSPFFSPRTLCYVLRNKDRRWCIHSIHCACAPESCVYFPRCCTCKLCFLCRSWEQLPEVLSKHPVWEVRGYLQTLPLSFHTGPCSCFLWRLWIWNVDLKHMYTHTHTRTFWDLRKATESLKSYWKNSCISAKFPLFLEDQFVCLCKRGVAVVSTLGQKL